MRSKLVPLGRQRQLPSGLAEQALADVGAGNKKSVLAIKDKDASTHDERGRAKPKEKERCRL